MDERQRIIVDTELAMSYTECWNCKGVGLVHGSGGDPRSFMPNMTRCPRCNGTGKVHKKDTVFNRYTLGNIG